MGKKMMFHPKNIYFGSLTFNAYPKGYYYQSAEAYEQIMGPNDSASYRKLDGSTSLYQEFYNGTKDYLSISHLIPMTEVMPEEKREQLVSKRTIHLYLLKYKFMGEHKSKQYVKINGNFPQYK
ncbi:MAG: hypothetical protein E7173_00855 [Firmicutes bacterium]|nr:hypothetical protein [Bacillota bacterium]